MKKKLFVLSLLFCLGIVSAKAQFVNVPDSNLRKALIERFPLAFTHLNDSLDQFGNPEMYNMPPFSEPNSMYGTYMMDTTNIGILTADSLDLPKLRIRDLQGIQYFKTLTHLNIELNNLCGSPALPKTLAYLDMSDNQNPDGPFGYLPSLPAGLKYFDCSNDSLINWGNLFFYLGQMPNGLETLKCRNAGIHDFSGGLPPSLLYLDCSGQLDHTLTSSTESLTQLPALPAGLITLICGKNAITSLPALPASLKTLDCSLMRKHDLDYNYSPTLFCVPRLPFTLENLSLPESVTCLPNYGLFDNGAAPTSMPLCQPGAGCDVASNISGLVFIDNNGNGIKDAEDLYKANTRVNLSNGIAVFTNDTGLYRFAAMPGTYSLSADAPYYTATPASIPFTFHSYDTNMALTSIALHPNQAIDSLLISITPVLNIARPGSPYYYDITYENAGTTILAPNITVAYDNAILTYTSASNPSVTDDGSALHLTEGQLNPGQRKKFTALFTVKTSVVFNTLFTTTATINANQATATDSSITITRGSYDPNDKQATAELLPEQVVIGKYIDYTIRFQNTGTDTAFHIIITDTLSSSLQAASFQLINTSHPCNVTRNGNILLFDFPNILLPDKNINEPGSHGFVRFRIRPTLSAINSIVPNSAAIYFDYNAPVITNIATTIIRDFGTIPLKLVSFNAIEQPGNKVSLYWSTANEISTHSFVIEQSTDAINFKTITSVAAKGSNANSYMQTIPKMESAIVYYRLKIMDNNGRYSYSAIITVKTVRSADGINIITNPAKNTVTIQITASSLHTTLARIITTNGVVVKELILKEGIQNIDVSNLSAGTYYLQTNNGTKKIVIIR